MSDIVYEALSVCKVIEGSYSDPHKHRLRRMYDINEETGEISKVYINANEPYVFGNRDLIFKVDGPSVIGDIGVWYWIASPNDKNPERDHVDSWFRPNIRLTYIIVLNEANSTDDIITKLRSGIQLGFERAYDENWMVLYKLQKNRYHGVYCGEGSFEAEDYSGTTVHLGSSVIRLDEVEVDAEDILHIDNRCIYRRLEVEPHGNVLTRSVNEIVKNAVLNMTTWKAFQAFVGGTRSERRLFVDFLNSIEADIYQTVAEQCGCDENTAIDYVSAFVDHATRYISNHDIETDVLVSLVNGNTDIRQRVEAIVEERWAENNRKRIDKAKEELDSIKAEQIKTADEIKIFKKKQQEEQRKNQEAIDKQKKLLEEIEVAISERILKYKNNLGEVLEEAVYYNSLIGETKKGRVSEIADDCIGGRHGGKIYEPGYEVKIEASVDCADMVNRILSINLEKAGVGVNYIDLISAFLTAVIHERMPIILAGSNGRAVADAISVSISGRTAGHIRSWENDELAEMIDGVEDRVICIDNFCKGDIIDTLPDLFEHTDKLLVLLTPYQEDLYIEPAGLYSYALPLLTEWFVEAKPSGDWCGGFVTDDWMQPIDNMVINGSIVDMMKNIGMKNYPQRLYTDIISKAATILNDRNREWFLACLVSLLPFTVVTGNMDKLLECIMENGTINQDSKNKILSLCGV